MSGHVSARHNADCGGAGLIDGAGCRMRVVNDREKVCSCRLLLFSLHADTADHILHLPDTTNARNKATAATTDPGRSGGPIGVMGSCR